MPKSKRERPTSLTQAKPKGRSGKEQLIQDVRAALELYSHVYTFDFQNFRTSNMKDVREAWAESRFFMGNNKVMQVALGRTPEEAWKPNLNRLAAFINGHCGLFFTNSPKSEVKKFFNEYTATDYARMGDAATVDFVIPKGPLENFQHTMEAQLRTLGLPVRLVRGVIQVEQNVQVCKVGDALTAESAKLLKLFGKESVEFKLNLTANWSNGVCRRVSNKASAHDDFALQNQEEE
jgi:mRNA turnover protein 4